MTSLAHGLGLGTTGHPTTVGAALQLDSDDWTAMADIDTPIDLEITVDPDTGLDIDITLNP